MGSINGGYGAVNRYNYAGPPQGRQGPPPPEAGSMDEFRMNLRGATGGASSTYKETLAMLDQAKNEKKGSSGGGGSGGGGGFLGNLFKPVTDLFSSIF